MRNRDDSIDFMKGILVVLMILGHVIQFFYCDMFSSYISLYVNLTTFSGFMFTYGYVCYKAYIVKPLDKKLVMRLARGMIKSLIAFYISGIAFVVILQGQGVASIVRVLALRDIPSFSECLFCFVFAYPVVAVWAGIEKCIVRKNTCGERGIECAKEKAVCNERGAECTEEKAGCNEHAYIRIVIYIVLAVISLAATKINYNAITIPVIGAFVGTYSFASFPLIQYMSLFIAGMYLSAKNKVFDWCVLLISIGGLGLFGAYILMVQDIPSRFPPSAPWITGGYLFVYLYYLISKKVSGAFVRFLARIGRNSLVFLVVSNVIIFSLNRLFVESFAAVPVWSKRGLHLLILVLCIAVSFVWLKLIEAVKDLCGIQFGCSEW